MGNNMIKSKLIKVNHQKISLPIKTHRKHKVNNKNKNSGFMLIPSTIIIIEDYDTRLQRITTPRIQTIDMPE